MCVCERERVLHDTIFCTHTHTDTHTHVADDSGSNWFCVCVCGCAWERENPREGGFVFVSERGLFDAIFGAVAEDAGSNWFCVCV